MEKLIIDSKTFEKLQRRIKILEQLTESMNEKYSNKKPDTYLSGEEVCHILNITPRTLPKYRDKGMINYIQVTRKILYRGSDVEKFLEENIKLNNQNLLV